METKYFRISEFSSILFEIKKNNCRLYVLKDEVDFVVDIMWRKLIRLREFYQNLSDHNNVKVFIENRKNEWKIFLSEEMLWKVRSYM